MFVLYIVFIALVISLCAIMCFFALGAFFNNVANLFHMVSIIRDRKKKHYNSLYESLYD